MKILIANDGSKFGHAAVELAAGLFVISEDTQIKVITVIEPAATLEIEAMIESVEDLTDPANPAAQKAAQIGEASVKSLHEKCGYKGSKISYEVLGGAAVPTIVEKAEEWQADLIVIGSHGYGFWKRALLGSVSDRVAHHAPCSVLVVRS